MKDAADYLAQVKALIVLDPEVVHWAAAREEAQGDVGLFRYKLVLRDGSRIELFELFKVVQESVSVTKYSFHWQDNTGRLRARWDNAPHHPEITTHPHHVHEGSEANVLPHAPVTVQEVLGMVAAEAVAEKNPGSPA